MTGLMGDGEENGDASSLPEKSANGVHHEPEVPGEKSACNINDEYLALLEELGGMGFFQMTRLLLLISISFFFFLNFTTIFTLEEVDHRCRLPYRHTEPWSSMTQTQLNLVAYPPENPGCQMYVPQSEPTNQSLFTSEKKSCDSFTLTHENVDSSATADFHLFCDRMALRRVAKAAFFVGMTFGGFVFGYIADIIGRKPVLVFCMAMNVVCVAMTSLSLNFYMFVMCRVLVGFSWPHYMAAITITAELVYPKYVPRLGFIFECAFGAGIAFLGFPVAYFVRSWRTLELVSAGVCVLGVVAALLCPESLRWLLIKGKLEQARKLARQIARANSCEISDEEIDRRLKSIVHLAAEESSHQESKLLTNLSLITQTPCLLSRVTILSIGWMVNSLMYFGFTLNTSALIPGNLYLNVVVGGLLETPAMVAAFLLVDRIGRKLLLVSAYVLAAVSCATVGFTHQSLPSVAQVAGLSGKLCITLTFGVIYVYTMELVPTCVRTTGLSLCSSMSRLGSVAAPFIVMATEVIWFPLTYVIYCSAVLITAALTMMLPETANRPLQDTIQDAIDFTRIEPHAHAKSTSNHAVSDGNGQNVSKC